MYPRVAPAVALASLLACTWLGLAPWHHALAEEEFLVTHIDGVRVYSNGYGGGCMAVLHDDPALFRAGCSPAWVSLDCVGAYGDKLLAHRMLGAAELALAMDTAVRIDLYPPEMHHNGYCVVKGFDANIWNNGD